MVFFSLVDHYMLRESIARWCRPLKVGTLLHDNLYRSLVQPTTCVCPDQYRLPFGLLFTGF
jgi:hypothetical protein